MNIKELVTKNKRIILCLVISLVLGIFSGLSNMPESEYNNLLSKKEELSNEIVAVDKTIVEKKSEVNALQVKKQEKENLAKAKAEEERLAKVAAEAKAKEEAAKAVQEEADRLAKEEADKKAQQQANINQSNGGGSTDNSASVGQTVWLAATGTKYHSKNNCGNMNPANARKVNLNEINGYAACKKCY